MSGRMFIPAVLGAACAIILLLVGAALCVLGAGIWAVKAAINWRPKK